jgi:four helix bundle protein
MSISRFRELKAWQLSMDLAERVYLLTDAFPKSETYGLTSQIRRAAVSVPSNLAEGCGRDSTKEFLHFIAIAVGSICEIETQLLLSQRLKYINTSDLETTISIANRNQKSDSWIAKISQSENRVAVGSWEWVVGSEKMSTQSVHRKFNS